MGLFLLTSTRSCEGVRLSPCADYVEGVESSYVCLRVYVCVCVCMYVCMWWMGVSVVVVVGRWW
jgi:hypothetical protein